MSADGKSIAQEAADDGSRPRKSSSGINWFHKMTCDAMNLAAITMPALADLLNEATILSRIDLGPVMTTTGRHPDRGAFTVVQSFAGSWLIAERDAYQSTVEITDTMIGDVIQVLRDASRRAGGFIFST
ncbi:hypothetical protein [Methylorubrum sp. POS3]|uniref:hypothetical protein n=1 Tax=Methylorubrum sp. POS3 TaxID=2998492 RepID=UPI0037281C09